MKKFLVVLTILVLVAGFAFATVTGTIEARYTFDFTDAKTLKYDVYGSSSKVSFTVSTEQAKVDGSVMPYATVTVDVALTAKIDETKSHPLKEFDYYIASWGDLDQFDLGVKLSDFRIVGENWEINFLKAVEAGDYAKSAWEVSADDKALDAKWSFGKAKGITLTYDGYKLGLAAERRENADGVYVLDAKVRAESKEVALAEGTTAQFAVGIGSTKKGDEDASFDFGVSAKAAYATDALTVNGAVDLQYVAKDTDLDVAVKVAVKPVTVDAYYATQVKATSKRYFFGSVDDILSVRVALALDPVTVTVYGENLINKDRILAIKEEGKFGKFSEDAQFGIMPSLGADMEKGSAGLWFANAGVGYDVMENLNVNAHVGFERLYVNDGDVKGHISGLAIQAGAEYKLEKVTLTADAYAGKMFAESYSGKESSDLYFACKISAESDKLVENAVLSATLNIDKEGVIDLYDSTRAVDSYSKATDPYDFGDGSMYFQVGCKVAF